MSDHNNTPAGWYASPSEAGAERYFDGTQWTEQRRPVQTMPVASVAAAESAGKPWYVRWWAIGLWVFLGLIMLGVAVGGDDDLVVANDTTTTTVRSALITIQATLGLNPQGSSATVAARIAAIPIGYKSGDIIRASSGSTTAPGWSFSNDTDTGVHRQNDASMVHLVGGVEKFVVGATSLATRARIFATNLSDTAAASSQDLHLSNFNEIIRVSSRRAMKQNITPAIDSLTKVMALESVTFDVKDSDAHLQQDGAVRVAGVTDDIRGFIAEDVAAIDPSMAALDSDGTPLGIGVIGIVSALVGAVQELNAKITALENA